MRILDRYLLRQFVQTFLICYVSMTGLFVVIDAFNNLDEFLVHARHTGSLAGVLINYYGYRTISFFTTVSGLLSLVAALFTISSLQRNRELTALQSAGISKRRVVTPLVLAALCVSLGAAATRELVLPRFRHQLAQSAQDLSTKKVSDLQPRYDHLTNILLQGKELVVNDHRIVEPQFMLPDNLDVFGRTLAAKTAYYEAAQNGRPAGYRFVGVRQPQRLLREASLWLQGTPVILTPVDYDWLADNECFVRSGIDVEMLEGGSGWRTWASTLELIQGLASPSLQFGADVQVAIHGRIVQPLLDMTLLFLGIPLVLARDDRNVFFAIGLCLLLTIGFVLVVMACQYIGASYWMQAALACWLPLFIFCPLAAWMATPLFE